MTDEEFDAYLEQSLDALSQKQGRLTASFGLGSYPQFWLDQPAGTLHFRDNTGRDCVVASITPIGSFCPSTKTWQWGWANPNVPQPLRDRAEKLKGLSVLTGFPLFSQRVVEVDEQMALELVAIAVTHLASEGMYRVPMSQVFAYFALDSVTHRT